MVMSVLVNREGKVCVVHDAYYEGRPVSLNYAPGRKSLTLVLDNGLQEHIGTAGLPEIARRLHHSRQVTLMQIRRPEPTQQLEVPLHIQIND